MSPPPPAYTIFVIPERSGRLRRFRLTHRQLMRWARLGLALVGMASVLGAHAWQLSRDAAAARDEMGARLDLRARLMRLARDAARLEAGQAQLTPRATRLAAMAALAEGAGGPAAGGLGEVLYAVDEQIDDEDEALDSQLGQQLAAGAPVAGAAAAAPGPAPPTLGSGGQMVAPADGVVAELVAVRGPVGEGWRLRIAHPGGMESHCGPLLRPRVRAGQRLRQGEIVGTTGTKAAADGPACEVYLGGQAASGWGRPAPTAPADAAGRRRRGGRGG